MRKHFLPLTPRKIARVAAFFALSLATPARAQNTPVLTGLDVLQNRNFDVLQSQRVGLVTNQSGRARDGRATIDVLRAAPGVRLVALFAPEHGVRGNIAAGQTFGDKRDAPTGLPIYSLYGATRQPTRAMLRGIQTLVFDLQDIGSRSYTYLATLENAARFAPEAASNSWFWIVPIPSGAPSKATFRPSFRSCARFRRLTATA